MGFKYSGEWHKEILSMFKFLADDDYAETPSRAFELIEMANYSQDKRVAQVLMECMDKFCGKARTGLQRDGLSPQ